MTSQQNLEGLFFEAAESDSQTLIDTLISRLSQPAVDIASVETQEHIALLIDSWGDSIESSEGKSLFFFRLCALSPADTPQLRNALFKSLKKTLPPDFPRNSAATAIGIKDASVGMKEISSRFNRLKAIRNGQFFFSEKENKWGNILSADTLTGELSVKDVFGTRKNCSVSLQKVLSEFLLFSADSVLFQKLASKSGFSGTSRSAWRSSLESFAVVPLTDAQVDKLAFSTLVPDILSLEQFNSWWKDAPATDAYAAGRNILSARNFKELHAILTGMKEKSQTIDSVSEDEKKKLGECMAKLKAEPSLKEQIFFAETLALLRVSGISASELGGIIRNSCVNPPFWPKEPAKADMEDLRMWDEIPCGHIPELLELTSESHSRKYLCDLLLVLPLRAINAAPAGYLDYDEVIRRDPLSSDFLLHIWKNRNSVPDKLLAKFSFRSIFHSISMVPSSWPNSNKELKKLLIENQEMQKYLLERHAENEDEIFEGIRMNRALTQHEVQSLLVKMSRLSPDFKKFLEKNQGRGAVNIQSPAASSDESPIPVTSMKSYGARVKEFEDIINKHLPENTAAIAHARGFGDLRENAEFSAAKERQRFLNRRKAELELDLANVIPLNFEPLTSNCAKIGTTICIDTNGRKEKYHIVGLWDSDPERNMLSSDSMFSKALMHKKIGETAVLPDGKTAVILSISPLPDEMIKDLNNEILQN